MKFNKRHTFRVATAALIAVAASVAVWLAISPTNLPGIDGRSAPETANLAGPASESPSPSSHRSGPAAVQPSDADAPAGTATGPDRDCPLAALAQRLPAIQNMRERQRLLDLALARLEDLPREKAGDILIGFLDSGQDADIGQPFRVGPGGRLRSHPTLRVAALDWLGNIYPKRAFGHAPRILARSDDPDEWAVALRNYGRRIEPGSDDYFSGLVREMITRRHWQDRPGDGFIEAFDAVVYNRQYELLGPIVEMVKTDTGLGAVGAVLIDALVQHDRPRAFRFLEENPGLLSGLPDLRADLMARADVRQPDQRRAVEAYLLDEGIAAAEKERFARVFPNFSRLLGHRLLTEDHVFSPADRAEIDAAALAAVNEWLDDERFAAAGLDWPGLRDRLARYVSSARRGGLLAEP